MPLILDLNFWHQSFLTIIMVDHYPLCEFLHAAKLSVALCYVALASSPRHQHLRCFHSYRVSLSHNRHTHRHTHTDISNYRDGCAISIGGNNPE